jgi:signal peptidase II
MPRLPDGPFPREAGAPSGGSERSERGGLPRRFWGWLELAATVIVLDQLTKWIVLANIRFGETIYVAPFWNWVLTYNKGAAFSFLADQEGWQRWFFTVLALGVSAWIVVMLKKHWNETLLALALSLILGGALGNVIDRIRFGAVVDFIQWHAAGFYWPAFNVADSAICVGAALMIWDQFRSRRTAPTPSQRPQE